MNVYADHAATTKLDIDAFEAMKQFLLSEYGNASQPYSFSRTARKALKEAREDIANCIGANPEEIYFTSGGTESDNWAIKGSAFNDGEKNLIITSSIEHHAVLHSCEDIQRMGYTVVYLPVDSYGVVSSKKLEQYLSTQKTNLVSIMFSNNEIGTIQDIAKLAELSHLYGAVFHTDAVQAVGHIKVDVNSLGVDMLSASGHKFNAPKGVGFLYIRKGIQLFPYISGGAQEFGMRAGTENVAGILAMSVALKNNCQKLEASTLHLRQLENILLSDLQRAGIDFVRNGSANLMPGNISLSFKNIQGEMLLHRLDLLGILVSTGSACNSKETKLSHVIEAIKVPKNYAYGTIRISLGAENTEEEVRYIASSISKILMNN